MQKTHRECKTKYDSTHKIDKSTITLFQQMPIT